MRKHDETCEKMIKTKTKINKQIQKQQNNNKNYYLIDLELEEMSTISYC